MRNGCYVYCPLTETSSIISTDGLLRKEQVTPPSSQYVTKHWAVQLLGLNCWITAAAPLNKSDSTMKHNKIPFTFFLWIWWNSKRNSFSLLDLFILHFVASHVDLFRCGAHTASGSGPFGWPHGQETTSDFEMSRGITWGKASDIWRGILKLLFFVL